jgi:hypothetical protein
MGYSSVQRKPLERGDMKKNVGGMDRGIRYAIGISGLAIALLGHRVGIYGRLKGLVLGAMGLYTASTGYCPMSEYMGINTAQVEKSRRRRAMAEQNLEAASQMTPVI